MTQFVAKRIQFRNGERHSILSRNSGVPVHEATLFLARFRTRGRAANTIHAVCTVLALFHRWLYESQIDLLARLRNGQFLSVPELNRLVDTTQYRVDALLDDERQQSGKSQIVDLKRIRLRRQMREQGRPPIGVENQATRLRYIVGYLKFLSAYVAPSLADPLRTNLDIETERGLDALRAQIPTVSKRATLGAREGLSREAQSRVLSVVDPNSPDNPWKQGFVRHRNWLIVVLLLATGMRRGELLNIQIGDLATREPKLNIIRRPDSGSDSRLIQPTPKTRERTLEVRPAIMETIRRHIVLREKIKAARKHPYLIVASNGRELGYKTIDKIFAELRRACPEVEATLGSHVMRHTWNDRFSEQAEAMQLSAAVEERARNEQQGWADHSKSAATYTRRYAARKGHEISLKIQEKLDGSNE